MQTTPARYRTFLLRMWWADAATCAGDRQASLQAATTDQPMQFANLEELFVFLINTAEADVVDHAASVGPAEQRLQDMKKVSSG